MITVVLYCPIQTPSFSIRRTLIFRIPPSQVYTGEGKTKKLAKLAVAESALNSFIQFTDASSAHKAMGKDKSLKSLTDFTSDDHFGAGGGTQNGDSVGSVLSRDSVNILTPFVATTSSDAATSTNNSITRDKVTSKKDRSDKTQPPKKPSRRDLKKMKLNHKRQTDYGVPHNFPPNMNGISAQTMMPSMGALPRFFSPTEISFSPSSVGSTALPETYLTRNSPVQAQIGNGTSKLTTDNAFTSFSSSPPPFGDFTDDINCSPVANPNNSPPNVQNNDSLNSSGASESRSSPPAIIEVSNKPAAAPISVPPPLTKKQRIKAKRKNKNHAKTLGSRKTKHKQKRSHAPSSFLSSSSAAKSDNGHQPGNNGNHATSRQHHANADENSKDSTPDSAEAENPDDASSTSRKNPVMILNEHKPGLKYEFISEVGESHAKVKMDSYSGRMDGLTDGRKPLIELLFVIKKKHVS